MRTYGRVYIPNLPKNTPANPGVWVEVDTDANGYDDAVYLTTLLQNLKLNLGESPFYSDYGIPAHPSVVQQLFPDYYVSLTQQRFSQYFASLLITRVPSGTYNPITPTYQVNVITHSGSRITVTVPE